MTFTKREKAERRAEFFVAAVKSYETKVVEEYYWAKTQARGVSSCVLSDSRELEFVYYLSSLLYTQTSDHTHVYINILNSGLHRIRLV
jgi:hypothetical protein